MTAAFRSAVASGARHRFGVPQNERVAKESFQP
ncbi:MAG: hypothetical protein FD161_4460 [Limisphaerales bacterium]|nr:MAG: hypothetical protein FD161_4460 [Limisphaerales bacterium]TXT46413.1 MAG: hypothetical protein FD140_4424 [Limisphaerales bacterium]